MQENGPAKSQRRTVTILVSFVFFMFAFTYMMVPIFSFVCGKVGINGKNVNSPSRLPATAQIDTSRTIKVQFTSVLHGNYHFKFEPLQREVFIHPGEHKTIYFYAENNTGTARTVQAVPSITPIDASRFLKKIECFCFTQQHFNKNEKAKMFVNFYIDPDVGKDIKEMTLAYTLFDAGEQNGQSKQATKGRIKVPS